MKKTINIFNVQNILLLVFICVVFCSCENRSDEKNLGAILSNNAEVTKILLNNNQKKVNCSENQDECKVNTEIIENKTIDFDTELKDKMLIRELLNTTNEDLLNLKNISNMFVGVSTITIAKTLRTENYNRNGVTSKEKARMLLWELIYNRGKPAWAKLLALSRFGDYYTYHGSKFPGRPEWVRELRKKVELSENPTEAEKTTFASVKLDLVRDLTYNESDKAINVIEEIRKMQKTGVAEFPEQPYLMLHIFKAQALLALNQETDARKEIQKLYTKLDSINDSVIHSTLDNGIDIFINRSKQIFPKVYPEYDRLNIWKLKIKKNPNYRGGGQWESGDDDLINNQ